MRRLMLALVVFVCSAVPVTAQERSDKAEQRIAFVVGNESYADGALPTAANDAGLVAQTLQAAGFEVIGARDLDAETLRQSYSDFLKRVSDAGPGAVAFVYLSGYGLQYGNNNYYVPIGGNISRDADIPIAAIRLADLTGPLEALNLKARFMVFDTAYAPPFRISGEPLAGGLALVDPSPGSLVAFNAAPGTVAPIGKQNYGVYAQSLAAELREGGLSPDEILDRVRLRVNEATKGAAVPWDASKIDARFFFFERGPDAPAPAASPAESAALTQAPLRDLPPKQAYVAAVARDTVQSYSSFEEAYPDDPLAKRVRILLAARREALTWRRTIASDTPAAYWSYLQRYHRGPHAYAARLRLGQLSAELEPPPDFGPIQYDVPPPPPYELDFVDRPVIYFDDPAFDLVPPPPPPDYWLPPIPAVFVDLPAPPEPDGLFVLPGPAFVPLPAYYNPPGYVVVPADNRFFAGRGGGRMLGTGEAGAIHQRFAPNVGAGAAVLAVALPAAAVARAAFFKQRGITTPAQLRDARRRPGGLDGAGAPRGPAADHRLPGANGRSLPPNAPERSIERGPAERGPGPRGAGEHGPTERGPGERGPGERGPGERGAAERGPGARGPGAREPGARGPGERGAVERGPGARGPGERGAVERGPGARGPGERGPGERGPGERGPGARGPDERGPAERGPGGRGPVERGPGAGPEGPRGQGGRGPGGMDGASPGGPRGPGAFPGGGRPGGMGGGPRPGGIGGPPGGGGRPGGGPGGGAHPGGAPGGGHGGGGGPGSPGGGRF